MSYQEEIRKNYEGLFEQDRGEELSKNVYDLKQQYNAKWGWYKLIRDLSNGDLTRFDEILELPVITVFNDLSFLKETEHHKEYIKTTRK